MSDDIKKRMFDIVQRVAGKQLSSSGKQITVETLLSSSLDDLDIDSITLLEVIMEVENDFDIELGEVDPESYETFQDVAKDLEKQLQHA